MDSSRGYPVPMLPYLFNLPIPADQKIATHLLAIYVATLYRVFLEAN